MKKLRYREIKYLATVTKAVNDEPGFEPWGLTDSYSNPIHVPSFPITPL